MNRPELSLLILKPRPMSSRGSSFLRSIQNDEMIPLDMLVRESVQNSLDASNPDSAVVEVKYTVTKSSPVDLMQLFPQLGLSEEECNEHPMIEIRDTGTSGLTGPDPAETGELDGNYARLVFELGDPQEREGAGGSWGLGKTVYFRMGIGLVVFYSRLKLDAENYMSRLIACFVESEDSDRRHLDEASLGIAWWGGNIVIKNDSEWITPISEEQVETVLSMLGTKPFGPDETGTAVIIPCLKTDEILPEEESKENKLIEADQISDYIRIAVQRWYSVRINNSEYPYGSELRIKVNNESIDESNMYPVFKWVRSLYDSKRKENESVYKDEIKIRQTFKKDTIAGCLISRFLSKAELGMISPDNERSPFETVLREKTEPPFFPLFAFVRTPGMILSWNEIRWMHHLPDTGERYFLSLFISNPDAELNESFANLTGKTSLEEYLRGTEKASHLTWQDPETLGEKGIVTRIREGVARKIRQIVSPQEESRSPLDLSMARCLSNAFLPGMKSVTGTQTGSYTRILGPTPKSSLALASLVHAGNGMIIEWKLHWGKAELNEQKISLEISTESGSISFEQWTNEAYFGTFPYVFDNFTLEGIDNRKQGSNPESYLSVDMDCEHRNRHFSISNTGNHIQILKLTGEPINRWILHGTLTVKKLDLTSDFRPEVKLSY